MHAYVHGALKTTQEVVRGLTDYMQRRHRLQLDVLGGIYE